MPLPPLLSLRPIPTPGLSAAAYVPWVMLSRALAFLRTLLVARLLGEAGKSAFGIYQPALEFINPLAALVMFGSADVAERYTAAFLKNTGPLALRQWLWFMWFRIALVGIGVSLLLFLGRSWISNAMWGENAYAVSIGGVIVYRQIGSLLLPCGAAIVLLALYQHLAAMIRGLRAYGAAAGMELLSAAILLVLSAIAAWYWNPARHPFYSPFQAVRSAWGMRDLNRDPALHIGTIGAHWLILAYGVSLALPLVLYGFLLDRHLRMAADLPSRGPIATFHPGDVLSYLPRWKPRWNPPRLTRFAVWALVRLLLVLLFGFLSLWGVRYLTAHQELNVGTHPEPPDPLASTASFSIPFRIAQLLAFLAVTLWASAYGIAARAWSHGQTRRAKVQFLRVGRLGAAALTLLAVALLLARPLFAFLLPAYAEPIRTLLPGMLALFLWYGLAAFFSTYSDLRESPQRGAAIWATAIFFQIAGIIVARYVLARFADLNLDPQQLMLLASAAGLLAPLLLTAPLLLLRPFKLTRATTPFALLTIAPAILLFSSPLYTWLAPPILLATLLALHFTGTLLRPHDRRAYKKWRTHHQPLTTNH